MTASERGGRAHHRPRRKRLRPLRWLAALLFLAAGGWFWFQWQCWGLQTTHTQAELANLPQGFGGFQIIFAAMPCQIDKVICLQDKLQGITVIRSDVRHRSL